MDNNTRWFLYIHQIDKRKNGEDDFGKPGVEEENGVSKRIKSGDILKEYTRVRYITQNLEV